MQAERIAKELLILAAIKSVSTPFGWSHPDCETLTEAARLLRGEPEPKPDTNAVGVISDPRIGAH